MSQKSEPQRRKLPQEWRHAMWHAESGLVVSPFNRTLPLDAASNAKSMSLEDLKRPRALEDDNIYLAFYPRRPANRGPLFSVLAINHEELTQTITNVGNSASPQYILDSAIRSQWRNLETSLLDVCTTLYNKHKNKHFFPMLTYPRWPRDHGYDAAHKTQELTLHCAKKAIVAFTMLTAFTSFVLSLWLTEFEDDCFDEAFNILAERRQDPMPRVWLQYLKESIVCTFTPGMRPGGYINPYTTLWGPQLKNFTRACVPFWMVWGHVESVDPVRLNDPGMEIAYFPPLKYIRLAQQRDLSFASIIIPYEHTHTFTGGNSNTPLSVCTPVSHSSSPPTSNNAPDFSRGLDNFLVENTDAYIDDPDRNKDEPPAAPNPVDRQTCVESGSGQRPGESWEEFFNRQNEILRRRVETEDDRGRQRREAFVRAAENGPTKTCTVYLWEQDEVIPTFYRRSRVVKSDARTEWKGCTGHQRFFWSHRNEWDLCPHLPAYPDGTVVLRDEDEETFEEYMGTSNDFSPLQKLPEPSNQVGAMMLDTVRAITERDKAPEEATFGFGFWSLIKYLHFRHGFCANLTPSWNRGLHPANNVLKLERIDLATKNLNYILETETLSPNATTSIVDFHNTALNTKLSYADLPLAWDLSRHTQAPLLTCSMNRIRLQRVTDAIDKTSKSPMYILRPPNGSRDSSPWFVATTSATAMLMVYRSTWNTMLEIARGLLDNHIPFYTVVERKRQKIKRGLRPRIRGLGSRPKHFSPSREDYAAYEIARDDVLRSHDGRAIRLMGGIVGRIASEIVADYNVLDGPNLVNELIVGIDGEKEYVDDAVEEERLDVVSGVYRVEGIFKEGTAHQSWWPKQGSFKGSGFAADQWLPRMEAWYQERRSKFHDGEYHLRNASQWKEHLRTNARQVQPVLAGSERIATEFIKYSSRIY